MSDAERLRRAINNAIPTTDLEWPGDDIVGSRICRAIVKEFGIAEEPPEGGSSWGHWRGDCMDLVHAILDVAEGDDE